MQEMTLEEIHDVGYSLLKVFTAFCDANNIRYSLGYGTALGAARHQGFIPWDDDIDVLVPRPDYDRLVTLYEDSDRYRLISAERDGNYRYPFAKFVDNSTVFIEFHGEDSGLGVWIDVFPVDGSPDEKTAQKSMLRYYRVMRTLIIQGFNVKNRKDYFAEKNIVKGVASYCIGAIASFTSFEKAKREIEKPGIKYPFEESEYVACMWAIYGEREILPRRWFDSLTKLKFGDSGYSVLGNYEEYLTGLYGSKWMEIPKEHGRFHGTGYWK